MYSEIYWIAASVPQRLAIMARPRAGDWLEDEVAHWKRSGVELVVSLLERHEIEDLGLEAEPALCTALGIDFLSFPIPDRGIPEAQPAVDFAVDLLNRRKDFAIQCRAGIGRSSIMAATAMVCSGYDPEASMTLIGQARGLAIPDTEAQKDWVLKLPTLGLARL
jgi:protein-tyrosine phosphatase